MNPDVLIVGGGPTGLAAGLFLTDLGKSVRIVEADATLSTHSKAFGVNPRTLTLLESTGVTERLLEAGRRMTGLNLHRGDRTIARVDATKADHKYGFMLIHSQADTERALLEALGERGVEVEFNTKLVEIANVVDGGVTATVEKTDGERERIDTMCALGADGARSTVRHELNIGFPGETWPENWEIIDLHLSTDLPDDRGHLFLHDDGAIFLIRLEGDVWRIGGNALPAIERLPAGTTAGDVVWRSDFTMRHLIAARIREGSIALAGDAAHIHSPLGGRGMNLGIEDAYVFAHLVADGRLRDYESVRLPIIRSVVGQVKRFTQMARGRTWPSRVVRRCPWLARLALSVGEQRMARFALGLDHEVKLTPNVKV